MTNFETTQKVKRLRSKSTDDELAGKIGISKPTLYTRLQKNNWKKSEIHLIQTL